MDVFEKVIFDDSTGKFKKRRKYIRIYIERRIERAGRACISAMSLRLAALLLRSRDSPYKGMGNEVKRGEKASVPNRFDNQHEWQRDKSEESSARPLMENVIPLSLSPFFPSTSSLHYLSLHLVSILPLDPPFYRACHATEKKRCVQIYRRWNHPVEKDDPESRTNRIESNRIERHLQRIGKRVLKNASLKFTESIPIYREGYVRLLLGRRNSSSVEMNE